MSEPFLGEIRMFGFNFAPRGWAFCNGQTVSISQNTALFALIGTFYGGNGVQTFQLPNLQSRVPIHQGQGTGLSPYTIGQQGGTEAFTLNQNQLPQHNHSLLASSSPATASRPAGAVLARTSTDAYAASQDGTTMNTSSVGFTGGNLPFPIIQPYLTINFCIALQGLFPSRN